MSAGIPVLLASVCLFASEYSDAQAKVKEKYPKEFAEIQKLAATDMDAARKKLQELASKGNIRLPRESSSRGSFSGRSGEFNRGGQFGGRGMQFGGRGGQFGGRGGRGGMQFGGRGMQFNMLQRYITEKQIAAKFPAEYAAADKEFLAAVAKLEALAAKAKVTLPLSTEVQIRKLRAKAPEEFAQLEELSQSDPRAVFGKLRELSEKHQIPLWEVRGDRRPGDAQVPSAPAPTTRKSPQQIMRDLQKAYPEEMKKIMILREEDPRQFARKLQELNNRYNKEKASGRK